MDWIQSIEMVGRRLVGRTAQGNIVELSQLASCGVPLDRSARKGCLEVPFDVWRPVPSAEYREAFGIKLEADACKHDVFEAEVDGLTLVVPTLVFLRALFRPNAQLLERAFAPQFVDLVAFLDMSEDPPKLMPDPNLPARMLSPWQSNPLQLFAWLYCYSSARGMAGSVHARALAGRVSLALPSGTASIAVHGKKVGSRLFVTEMSIKAVTPEDAPVLHCDLTRSKYLLRGTRMEAEEQRTVQTKQLADIPTHADGSVELSDEEWRQVEPILFSNKGVRQKHCARAIADGVLTKLRTETPWSKVAYREGRPIDAIAALNRWHHSGRFASMLIVLRKHRGSVAAA